jgi:L-iditol 2-dehydrogenase
MGSNWLESGWTDACISVSRRRYWIHDRRELPVIGVAKLTPGPGGLGLVQREERELEPGEVRLEVTAAGVCGTDLHIEAGEMDVPSGVILGHEVSGIVVEVGPNADRCWLDSRVVSETYFSTCGTCDRCREGRVNLCSQRRSIGIHVDGAFAERVIVPVGNLHLAPEAVDSRAVALTEPLACVCRCLLDPAVVTAGDSVLVTGPGPIGLLAAQVAAHCGGHVVVSGLATDASRLAIARSLGFDTASADEAHRHVDVAIECSGSAAGATSALTALRKGGRYVQLGIFGKPVNVPLDHIVMKELRVRTGYATTPPAWRHALALLAGGRVALEPLVSETARLSDFQRVFSDLRSGHSTKVLFDPHLAA